MAGLKIPRLLVAGTHSGVGKTTVTLGLARLLQRWGRTIQPFKVGPDYIDPGYLSRSTGRVCRNLDGWLVSRERMTGLFHRACRPDAWALAEGVMGLFDGTRPDREEGSTGQIARWLDFPVLLVLDVSAMARSAAAVVKGYQTFDPRVQIAGCFLNRVGSEGHFRLVQEAIKRETGLPVIGWLPRDGRLSLPERHLGLVASEEGNGWEKMLPVLERRMEEGVNRSALLRVMDSAKPFVLSLSKYERFRFTLRQAQGDRSKIPIGVAMDQAFHFYYRENLELLEANGAEIVPFSPLKAGRLPKSLGALYLGGGFPELFAKSLSANRSLRQQIGQAVRSGMPTYAECGGLMYLSRSIETSDGRRHAMVGAVPASVRMTDRLQNFGYQEVRARGANVLARAGETARGHEFHHSALKQAPSVSWAAYQVQARHGGAARPEGFARGSLLASYVHLHFGSQPRWAERFVRAAQQWKAEKGLKE
ncbi:MAG: cobyrinate a,c-diamide synthase [Candidatus Omnitrophica bacterium]|nr:cobyrinate a,c-diamide synthase [Candidatus Omnitrophota bacterium]